MMDQVKTLAAIGVLRPADQLPSIRDLAEQLRVNRNTIAKVYALLEQEGVVELRLRGDRGDFDPRDRSS